MRIGIIDAELIGRKNHRFPNLVCEKLSGYWKDFGADVQLLLSYDNLDKYDRVYISKVFTDTPIPDEFSDPKNLPANVYIGGTGFYFDNAPALPEEIEHHMPDYHLYDNWIVEECKRAEKTYEEDGKHFNKSKYIVQFKEYQEYSIGFITRGCFRKCEFCVNRKHNRVYLHSPLQEFYDETRKKICLLDDNFLGYPDWKSILNELIATKKPFKFKQGLDERLLTKEKCELLFSANYDGDYTFAFDNIEDYDIIHKKLELIAEYGNNKSVKFYVLVGFKSTDAFDIENAFKRIELLLNYGCLPYIMRFQNENECPWKKSEFRNMYIAMARWCNQPSIIKKMSFREFCIANQKIKKNPTNTCSTYKAMIDFENSYPDIANKYFNIKFNSSMRKNRNGH